jgi:hypothetical protein
LETTCEREGKKGEAEGNLHVVEKRWLRSLAAYQRRFIIGRIEIRAGGSGGEQVEGRLGEERNESRKNILLHRWRWAASLAAAGTRG